VLKNYFFWRVTEYSKFYMSIEYKQPALKLHETFYGRQTPEQQWKRCVSQLKSLLGISITALTARNENAQSRKEINEIIEAVKVQVKSSIEKIPMNATEKEALIENIFAISIFIGYADEFYEDKILEDYYSNLEIYDGEFFKTAMKLESFGMTKYGEKKNKPIKETKWENTNSFAKSFYSTGKRTIFIHPNDLKSPIYNAELPNYVNYARLGWQVASLYGIAITFEV
jgi:predicted metalloendopeptidase